MRNVDQLLRDFDDDDADRCWIVAQLEEVADERVVSRLVSSLEDSDEDDEVRAEILKSLVARNDTNESRVRLGMAVVYLLRNEEDELLRQYAAKALRSYPDVRGVLECLESLVKSDSEDIDVRHNALTAIESNRSLLEYRESLKRLVTVPGLGRSAQRALEAEWGR